MSTYNPPTPAPRRTLLLAAFALTSCSVTDFDTELTAAVHARRVNQERALAAAERAFDRAETDEQRALSGALRVELLLGQERSDEAAHLTADMTRNLSQEPHTWRARFAVHLASGDIFAARRAAERLGQLTPDWTTDLWQRDALHLAEALLAIASGAFEQAQELCERRQLSVFRPPFERLLLRLSTLRAEVAAETELAARAGVGDGLRDLDRVSRLTPDLRASARSAQESARRALRQRGNGPPLQVLGPSALQPNLHTFALASPAAESAVLAQAVSSHLSIH